MAADVRTVNKTGLAVGEWVQFVTEQDLKEAPVEQQEIYQQNQRFLVISRQNDLFDSCRCFLVDMAGKRYDYSARMNSLQHTRLVNEGTIRAVSRDSVESIHGVERVQSVYRAAQKHIEDLADYFAEYPAQFLGQSALYWTKNKLMKTTR
jgi:hypothetical protein